MRSKIFFILLAVPLALVAQEPHSIPAPWERGDDFYSLFEPQEYEESECPAEDKEEFYDSPLASESVHETGQELDAVEDIEDVKPSIPSLDYIARKHSLLMINKAGLYWVGSRDLHRDAVDSLSLVYECYHACDINEARRRLVICVEEFLAMVNEGEFIHPQLGHFPFTASDLEIEIHFDNFFSKYFDRLRIDTLTMSNGIIHFNAFDCQQGLLCHVRNEMYLQSKDHVELEKKITPKKDYQQFELDLS